MAGASPTTSPAGIWSPPRAGQFLLIGRTLLRYFPSNGGAKGLVTKYIIDKDVYQLQHSDVWIEHITLDNALLLLPKSWKRKVAEANYASVCAHLAAATYVANAISGEPIANLDASIYTDPKSFRLQQSLLRIAICGNKQFLKNITYLMSQ